ncbi:hypothetical protein GDO78_015963 [Eleutherodactylus coqui]|uniref:Uncharacterized protein n=1 Tax=Eleutherodactylus coqui TaxID=57060 RepID=A0A8J6ED07_ELECQ|nr:hypothetical protein GDO78_015963 [Eleutherodactylus coqui]
MQVIVYSTSFTLGCLPELFLQARSVHTIHTPCWWVVAGLLPPPPLPWTSLVFLPFPIPLSTPVILLCSVIDFNGKKTPKRNGVFCSLLFFGTVTLTLQAALFLLRKTKSEWNEVKLNQNRAKQCIVLYGSSLLQFFYLNKMGNKD